MKPSMKNNFLTCQAHIWQLILKTIAQKWLKLLEVMINLNFSKNMRYFPNWGRVPTLQYSNVLRKSQMSSLLSKSPNIATTSSFLTQKTNFRLFVVFSMIVLSSPKNTFWTTQKWLLMLFKSIASSRTWRKSFMTELKRNFPKLNLSEFWNQFWKL